jgi:5-methylcytosine-specific restriction endonuclease McrA
MIRIDRGEEPMELVRERSRQLALAKRNGRPKKSEDFKGYGGAEVRNRLLEAQAYRCAYCELPLDEAGYPIEHFRPKTHAEQVSWKSIEPPPDDHYLFIEWFVRHFGAKAVRSPWSKDIDHYWWLAWSWENLFYACSTCNSQAYKGNKFPLKRGSALLAEWDELPGHEDALLLNPTAVDPLDHMRFAPDLEIGGWGPIALTEEGRWTIGLLGLNKRTGLRTHWKKHAGCIETDPTFENALVAKNQGDDAAVRKIWGDLVTRLLGVKPDYLGLRWCVFDHHFPEAYRIAHNLALPRPGRLSTRKPNPLWETRTELDVLLEQTQYRVRALAGNASEDEIRALVVDLCTELPLDEDELTRILRRSPPNIKMHLAVLTAAHDSPLTRDPASGKFHPSR